MKRLILCACLILTMGLLSGCGSKDKTPDSNTNDATQDARMNQYDNAAINFAYPQGWVLRESETPVGRVIILYAPENDQTVNTNMNVIIQDLSQSEEAINLESYTKISKDSLDQIVEDLEIISEAPRQMSGNEGFEISYKGTTKNNPSKDFQWWQAWTVDGDKAYIFTLTGNPDTIDEHMAAAQGITDSFSIKR